MRLFALVLAVASLAFVSGCTNADCLSAANDAHAAFLAEVEADPTAFTPAQQRQERLAYAGARAACMAFARANPAAQ